MKKTPLILAVIGAFGIALYFLLSGKRGPLPKGVSSGTARVPSRLGFAAPKGGALGSLLGNIRIGNGSTVSKSPSALSQFLKGIGGGLGSLAGSAFRSPATTAPKSFSFGVGEGRDGQFSTPEQYQSALESTGPHSTFDDYNNALSDQAFFQEDFSNYFADNFGSLPDTFTGSSFGSGEDYSSYTGDYGNER